MVSRPIKLTEEMVRVASSEFAKQIKSAKMFDGRLSYTKSFAYKEDNAKAILAFTAEAYAKMTILVQSFSTEVAWHAVVYRDEHNPARFNIVDIVVYPQTVTGSTVDMDEMSYYQWIADNAEKDWMKHIQFQGHSHVNMGVSPSGMDLAHQRSVLESQRDDLFYIFMIVNKKFDWWATIFDLRENTLYEKDDIQIMIGENGVDLNKFVEDAKEMVTQKTFQTAKKQKKGLGTTYGGWAGTAERVPYREHDVYDGIDYSDYWESLCDQR